MTDTRPHLGNRDVLRIPDFRRLWIAQTISDLGDGATYITLLFLVNNLTHSTIALAIMAIAVAVPPMTIGLVAGAYVDRLDRRRIMLVSDTLRGVLVLGFIATGAVAQLPILYVLAFVQAAIGTFFSPARGALIPRIVPAEGLVAANSLGQLSRITTSVIGIGLAGVIVGVTGSVWPSFVLDAATFFVSVAIVYRVKREYGRPEAEHSASSGGIGASVGAGLRTIGHSRTLLATVVGITVAMLGLGAINVLFVPFLVNVLHESQVWAGPLEASQTASMIIAAGLVATLAKRYRPSTIVPGAMVGVAVVVGLFSVAPNVYVLMVLLFAAGLFVMPLQTAATTILQTNTVDAMRGRVLAALQASTSTATIISTAAAGILADVLSVRGTVAIGAAIVGVGALVAGILYLSDRRAPQATPAQAADPTPAQAA